MDQRKLKGNKAVGTRGKVPINHPHPPRPCGLSILVELNAVCERVSINSCIRLKITKKCNKTRVASNYITLPDGWETKSITWKWGGVTCCYKRDTTHQDTLQDSLGKQRFIFKANDFLEETPRLNTQQIYCNAMYNHELHSLDKDERWHVRLQCRSD
jgi:hypothetical protein